MCYRKFPEDFPRSFSHYPMYCSCNKMWADSSPETILLSKRFPGYFKHAFIFPNLPNSGGQRRVLKTFNFDVVRTIHCRVVSGNYSGFLPPNTWKHQKQGKRMCLFRALNFHELLTMNHIEETTSSFSRNVYHCNIHYSEFNLMCCGAFTTRKLQIGWDYFTFRQTWFQFWIIAQEAMFIHTKETQKPRHGNWTFPCSAMYVVLSPILHPSVALPTVRTGKSSNQTVFHGTLVLCRKNKYTHFPQDSCHPPLGWYNRDTTTIGIAVTSAMAHTTAIMHLAYLERDADKKKVHERTRRLL